MLESMVSLHSHVTRLGVLDIGSNTVHMPSSMGRLAAVPEPRPTRKAIVE